MLARGEAGGFRRHQGGSDAVFYGVKKGRRVERQVLRVKARDTSMILFREAEAPDTGENG